MRAKAAGVLFEDAGLLTSSYKSPQLTVLAVSVPLPSFLEFLAKQMAPYKPHTIASATAINGSLAVPLTRAHDFPRVSLARQIVNAVQPSPDAIPGAVLFPVHLTGHLQRIRPGGGQQFPRKVFRVQRVKDR